jgi:hypothetical protein
MLRILASALILAALAQAQTARDYYNELYAAGGLDRMADEYVCFQDKQEATPFFIFGHSEIIREFLKANGQFSKLTKTQQRELSKSFLIMRGYNKGIPWKEESYFDKDGDSWVTEKGKLYGGRLRLRLTINWQTLRYKYAAEILDKDGSYQEEKSSYGRCERVSPKVPQVAD